MNCWNCFRRWHLRMYRYRANFGNKYKVDAVKINKMQKTTEIQQIASGTGTLQDLHGTYRQILYISTDSRHVILTFSNDNNNKHIIQPNIFIFYKIQKNKYRYQYFCYYSKGSPPGQGSNRQCGTRMVVQFACTIKFR